MRSAAARKILSVRENLGGSGAGSFRPRRWSSPDVTPAAAGVSIALIVRFARFRGIVLAVLVLVRLGLEAGHVDPDRHGRVSGGTYGDRRADLGALLVPCLH